MNHYSVCFFLFGALPFQFNMAGKKKKRHPFLCSHLLSGCSFLSFHVYFLFLLLLHLLPIFILIRPVLRLPPGSCPFAVVGHYQLLKTQCWCRTLNPQMHKIDTWHARICTCSQGKPSSSLPITTIPQPGFPLKLRQLKGGMDHKSL